MVKHKAAMEFHMVSFLGLVIFGLDFVKANRQEVEADVGSPRTGCILQFATFGFLTFLITLLNTLLNIGENK